MSKSSRPDKAEVVSGLVLEGVERVDLGMVEMPGLERVERPMGKVEWSILGPQGSRGQQGTVSDNYAEVFDSILSSNISSSLPSLPLFHHAAAAIPS